MATFSAIYPGLKIVMITNYTETLKITLNIPPSVAASLQAKAKQSPIAYLNQFLRYQLKRRNRL